FHLTRKGVARLLPVGRAAPTTFPIVRPAATQRKQTRPRHTPEIDPSTGHHSCLRKRRALMRSQATKSAASETHSCFASLSRECAFENDLENAAEAFFRHHP